MAHTLAYVYGTAIAPGVSRNGRLYTKDMIRDAVTEARTRLAADGDDMPLVMLTHHDAGDDSERIAGRLADLTYEESTGRARYKAAIPDTPTGRQILALADTDGGPPFLKGVSIRGAWKGAVRRVVHNGQTAETADSLTLHGLDFTHSPGVIGAGIDRVEHVTGRPRETADGRPMIFESVDEAELSFTEAAPDNDEPGCDGSCCKECGMNATENASAVALAEKGAPALKSGKPAAAPTPGASDYADPGYQDDKAKRYPLDTKAHARAAWSYINQPRNAKMYTAAQLKRIKARIVKALTKFGVKVDTKEGWIITPAELVTETGPLAEADMWPDRPGCFSVCIDNGMVSINISSYQVDPADLEVAACAAMQGACAALAAIDPDMDGDIDQPGPDDDDGPKPTMAASHPDDDAMEHAPDAAGVTETPADPAGDTNTAKEGAGMADPTNTPADQAPPAAAPTAEAPQEAVASGPSVTFTDEQFRQFLAALRPEPVAAGAPAESAPEAEVTEAAEDAAPVAETQEQLVARLVAEGVRSALQDHAENGGVQRKGLVTEQAVPGAAPVTDEFPESWPRENGVPVPAHKMTAEQWKTVTRDTLPGSIMHGRG